MSSNRCQDKQDNLPYTYPLRKLTRNKEEASLKKTISHLSYQELVEIKELYKRKETRQQITVDA